MKSAQFDSDALIGLTERRSLYSMILLALLILIAGVCGTAALAWFPISLRPWFATIAFGLSSLFVGAVTGLLFAVPRRSNELAPQAGSYVGNDNLVKVSDWLTSALTGIALATATTLGEKLWAVSQTINADAPGVAAVSATGAFAAGFLMGYLRLRANLPAVFAFGEHRATSFAQVRASAAEESNMVALKSVAYMLRAEKRDLKSAEFVRSIRATHQTSYAQDPVRDIFGTQNQAGGYQLNMVGYEVARDGLLIVDLEVRADEGKPAPTTATFHLHPSYPASRIEKPVSDDGIVRMRLPMFETSTVGVVVGASGTKLGLDLSQETALPEEYRAG